MSVTKDFMTSEVVIDFKNPENFHDRVLVVEETKFYVVGGVLSLWTEFFRGLFSENFEEANKKEIEIKEGITLKPIAKFLQVEKKSVHKKNMTEHIYQELIDYTMTGMEDIAGFKGHHWIRDTFQTANQKYLKPLLVNKNARKEMDQTKIVRNFKRLQMEDAESLIKAGSDVGRNAVFVNALVEHTRKKSASLGPSASSVDLNFLKEQHGITVYDDYSPSKAESTV